VATLVTEQGIIHYEAYGRGRPVLLLHGWLNSWEVWRETVQVLGREFRVYALDFLGFGDSGDRAEEYSVRNFTRMVSQFMDRMGILRAPIVGHSMGGTVALSGALQYPEKVVKVIVVGSPIEGTSLSPLLKLAANRTWINLGQNQPVLYSLFQAGFKPILRGYSHFLARDGGALGRMLTDDMSKLAITPFIESITTLRETDLRQQIGSLQMPILGVYGRKDLIVDPKQAKVLKTYAPDAEIAWFTGSGHFPMMDERERFFEVLRTFLNTNHTALRANGASSVPVR
jgi:pimeloyl-ACP methyl ester carboxylesterase